MRHELKRSWGRGQLATLSVLGIMGCAPVVYESGCIMWPDRAPFTPSETSVIEAYEALAARTPEAFADSCPPMHAVGLRSGPVFLDRARGDLQRLQLAAPAAMEAWPADLGPAMVAAADRLESGITELEDGHADAQTVADALYQLGCETVRNLVKASAGHLEGDAVAGRPFEGNDMVPLALLIYAEQSRLEGRREPDSLWEDSCPHVQYADSPGPGGEVEWPNAFADMPPIIARAAEYCGARPPLDRSRSDGPPAAR
jgi:hypothetical protein